MELAGQVYEKEDGVVHVSLAGSGSSDAGLRLAATEADRVIARAAERAGGRHEFALDASDNPAITDAGVVRYLSVLLRCWPNCRVLRLDRTSVGDAALAALGEFVASGSALEVSLAELAGGLSDGAVFGLLERIHSEGRYPKLVGADVGGGHGALSLRLERNGVQDTHALLERARSQLGMRCYVSDELAQPEELARDESGRLPEVHLVRFHNQARHFTPSKRDWTWRGAASDVPAPQDGWGKAHERAVAYPSHRSTSADRPRPRGVSATHWPADEGRPSSCLRPRSASERAIGYGTPLRQRSNDRFAWWDSADRGLHGRDVAEAKLNDWHGDGEAETRRLPENPFARRASLEESAFELGRRRSPWRHGGGVLPPESGGPSAGGEVGCDQHRSAGSQDPAGDAQNSWRGPESDRAGAVSPSARGGRSEGAERWRSWRAAPAAGGRAWDRWSEISSEMEASTQPSSSSSSSSAGWRWPGADGHRGSAPDAEQCAGSWGAWPQRRSWAAHQAGAGEAASRRRAGESDGKLAADAGVVVRGRTVAALFSGRGLDGADLEPLLAHLDRELRWVATQHGGQYSWQLDLSSNPKLTDADVVQHVIPMLGRWPACRKLKLYRTSIGGRALEALTPWIAAGHAHEVHLSDLGCHVPDETVHLMLAAIRGRGLYPYTSRDGESCGLWLRLEHNALHSSKAIVQQACSSLAMRLCVLDRGSLQRIRPGAPTRTEEGAAAEVNLVLFHEQGSRPSVHAGSGGREQRWDAVADVKQGGADLTKIEEDRWCTSRGSSRAWYTDRFASSWDARRSWWQRDYREGHSPAKQRWERDWRRDTPSSVREEHTDVQWRGLSAHQAAPDPVHERPEADSGCHHDDRYARTLEQAGADAAAGGAAHPGGACGRQAPPAQLARGSASEGGADEGGGGGGGAASGTEDSGTETLWEAQARRLRAAGWRRSTAEEQLDGEPAILPLRREERGIHGRSSSWARRLLRAVQSGAGAFGVGAEGEEARAAVLEAASGLPADDLADLARACARARFNDRIFVRALVTVAVRAAGRGAALGSLAHLASALTLLAEACAGGAELCAPLLQVARGTFEVRWASPEPCQPIDVLELVRCFAVADRLDEGLHGAAWDALRRWGLGLEDPDSWRAGAVVEDRERPPDDSRPRLLASCEHWDLVWKPAGWAVSWTVSVSANHSAVPAEAEKGVPFAPDRPFAAAAGRDCDLLGWLLDEGREGQPLPPIRCDALVSYGVVHRLDVGTSGPMCCARSYYGWAWVNLQFSAMRVIKEYVCLCHGWLTPPSVGDTAVIALPLRAERGRSLVDRRAGRRAVTELQAVEHLADEQGGRYSLVELRLHTGRLHQIRAHLAALGHPLVADVAYGAEASCLCRRPFLHCRRLGLPTSGVAGLAAAAAGASCALTAELRGALRRLVPTSAEEAGGGGLAVAGLWEKWVRGGLED